MIIREAVNADLPQLLHLYTHLHEKSVPQDTPTLKKLWEEILADKNHHIIVAENNEKIISSCVCVIIPNLTHELRPYALVENVVTDSDWRAHGCASACLEYAAKLAIEKNCYKIMLMTGSKLESTLNFYEKNGYNKTDKTGFIRWL